MKHLFENIYRFYYSANIHEHLACARLCAGCTECDDEQDRSVASRREVWPHRCPCVMTALTAGCLGKEVIVPPSDFCFKKLILPWKFTRSRAKTHKPLADIIQEQLVWSLVQKESSEEKFRIPRFPHSLVRELLTRFFLIISPMGHLQNWKLELNLYHLRTKDWRSHIVPWGLSFSIPWTWSGSGTTAFMSQIKSSPCFSLPWHWVTWDQPTHNKFHWSCLNSITLC